LKVSFLFSLGVVQDTGERGFVAEKARREEHLKRTRREPIGNLTYEVLLGWI